MAIKKHSETKIINGKKITRCITDLSSVDDEIDSGIDITHIFSEDDSSNKNTISFISSNDFSKFIIISSEFHNEQEFEHGVELTKKDCEAIRDLLLEWYPL